MFCFLFYKSLSILPPKKTVISKESIIDVMEVYPNKRGMQQWRLWVTEKEEKKSGLFPISWFFKMWLGKMSVFVFHCLLTNCHTLNGLKQHVYYLVSVGQNSGHGSPGLLVRVSQGYMKVLGRSVFSSGVSLGRICFQAYSGCWHIRFHVAPWLMALASLAVAGGCPQVLQVTCSSLPHGPFSWAVHIIAAYFFKASKRVLCGLVRQSLINMS